MVKYSLIYRGRLSLAAACSAALIIAFNLTHASVLAAPINVKVQGHVVHRIDPRLFGQFMERPSWDGEIGSEAALIPGTNELRQAVKELIRKMRIPILRFPGGTDVDYINWLNMIDNLPGRSGGRPITRGHRGDAVTNNFGYDEFLSLCEEIKATPLLVINFRDGLLAEDGPDRAARNAAKLVAYCNAEIGADLPAELRVWPRLRAENGHAAPFAVKYFQIGNETWRYAQNIGEDRYFAALQAYIEAIHAVDPTAHIIVDGHPAKIARRVHQQLGDRISYYAVHHYQPGRMTGIKLGDRPVDNPDLDPEDIWYV